MNILLLFIIRKIIASPIRTLFVAPARPKGSSSPAVLHLQEPSRFTTEACPNNAGVESVKPLSHAESFPEDASRIPRVLPVPAIRSPLYFFAIVTRFIRHWRHPLISGSFRALMTHFGPEIFRNVVPVSLQWTRHSSCAMTVFRFL